MPQPELRKLGPQKPVFYVQLESHPTHYLVIIITDEEFRYALINTEVMADTLTNSMVMGDIAWLDFSRIKSDDLTITVRTDRVDPHIAMKRRRSEEKAPKTDLPSAG